MLGWEEMAQKVSKAYSLLSPQEKEDVFIFCNNYGMAGAVSYYAPKYHYPAAFSDNASFLYWLPLSKNITNMILVTDDPNEATTRLGKRLSANSEGRQRHQRLCT
jgi:hypothetical protein